MQNAYISNTKRDLDLSIFNGINKRYPTRNKRINLFYTEGNESIVKFKHGFIANLGTLVYKNQFNKKALELIHKEMLDDGIDGILSSDDIHGQFVIILKYKKNLFVITDKLGYYPMYCYRRDGVVEVSSAFLPLAKNNKCTLDVQGVAEYLSENITGHACCDKNLAEEIKYLSGGTIYRIDDDITQDVYYDIRFDVQLNKYKSFKDVADRASKILDGNLEFIKNVDGNVHGDITGGLDTRVIFSKLIDEDIKWGLEFVMDRKHYTNTGKYSEFKIVDKIAKQTGVFLGLYYGENNNISFNLTNKHVYKRRANYFDELQEEGANLLISGLTGTELLRQTYVGFSSKDTLRNFFKRYYPLVNIMKDKLITETEYHYHIFRYLTYHFKNLKFKTIHDVATYSDYVAFYRTHFCRYLSLANSFMPFYTPYGEHNFAKLMFETDYRLKKRFKIQRYILSKTNKSLASIDTTRGFPATLATPLNFWRFFALIKKEIPQQFIGLFKKGRQYLEHKKDVNVINEAEELIKQEKLPVFRVIDKKKLMKIVKKDKDYVIFDRVVLLNKIMEELGENLSFSSTWR